jgi:prepilin-type N-terminal cleavage/methylation domain-containing protein
VRAPHSADKSSGDAGFTLVELVVSLTVLAVGIIGMVGVTASAFNLASNTTGRSQALAIGTRELESFRARPYEQIAVNGTIPPREEVSGSYKLKITTAITWVADGANTQAFKRGTVIVSWSDASGAHQVSQTTYFYPGGLGPAAVTTTTVACGAAPAAPASLTATASIASGTPGVALSWVPAAAPSGTVRFWVVESSTTGTFEAPQRITETQPPASTTLHVDALSPNVTYWFRVAASDACQHRSAWSTEASTATGSVPAPSCVIGTPDLSPASVKLSSNTTNAPLVAIPTLTLNTNGSCTTLSASYKKKPNASVTTVALVAGAGGIRSTSLSKAGPWSVGDHVIDIVDAAGVKRGTVTLSVLKCSGQC